MWTRQKTKTRRPNTRRLMAESLENRNLMAGVVFDSLSGIGNGNDNSQAFAIDADQVGNSYVTVDSLGPLTLNPTKNSLTHPTRSPQTA